MNPASRILRLDASASPGDSNSRKLGDRLLQGCIARQPEAEVRSRDLNDSSEFIDAAWIAANLSAAEDRDATATQRLAYSDELITELQWADHVILTTPMYNFGVPATLKAWIDQVCRAGITFRYTHNGPVGLLADKRADIVITTGGVPIDSPADFVSGYLRQVFAFIGIDAVEVFGADRMNLDSEASFARAQQQIRQHFSTAAA